MKRALIIGLTIFVMTVVFNPLCFAQDKGKGGKAKGPTHEEFVAMYDKDGSGDVSMDEFLEGPKEPPAGGKKGAKKGKK